MKHGYKYDYSKVQYVDSRSKVEILCKKHNRYFRQKPANHLMGQGCPICKSSKLEIEISKWLDENNIEYIQEHGFDWLIFKDYLSLDFYLPKYNVAIECQGKQHFGIGGWKDTDEEYQEIYERDSVKRDLCNKNGVKLLYYSNLGIEYPYEVFEDKEQLLEEIKKKL